MGYEAGLVLILLSDVYCVVDICRVELAAGI